MKRRDVFCLMSDEELAQILLEMQDGEGGYCRNLERCEKALNEDELIPDEWCVECIIAWLREEIL